MTTWTERDTVTTSWTARNKPTIFIAPLQDAYREVHNEDDEVIYIISTEWKEIASTVWTARPVLDD